MSNKFVIAVYVDNQFGVLTRVTSMFTRRGFNIDALTVGETECPEYSRITISLSGDGYAKEQLINQMKKLVLRKILQRSGGDICDAEVFHACPACEILSSGRFIRRDRHRYTLGITARSASVCDGHGG